MKKAGALGGPRGRRADVLAMSADGHAPARIAKAGERAWRALGVDAEASVHGVAPAGAREA